MIYATGLYSWPALFQHLNNDINQVSDSTLIKYINIPKLGRMVNVRCQNYHSEIISTSYNEYLAKANTLIFNRENV